MLVYPFATVAKKAAFTKHQRWRRPRSKTLELSLGNNEARIEVPKLNRSREHNEQDLEEYHSSWLTRREFRWGERLPALLCSENRNCKLPNEQNDTHSFFGPTGDFFGVIVLATTFVGELFTAGTLSAICRT